MEVMGLMEVVEEVVEEEEEEDEEEEELEELEEEAVKSNLIVTRGGLEVRSIALRLSDGGGGAGSPPRSEPMSPAHRSLASLEPAARSEPTSPADRSMAFLEPAASLSSSVRCDVTRTSGLFAADDVAEARVSGLLVRCTFWSARRISFPYFCTVTFPTPRNASSSSVVVGTGCALAIALAIFFVSPSRSSSMLMPFSMLSNPLPGLPSLQVCQGF